MTEPGQAALFFVELSEMFGGLDVFPGPTGETFLLIETELPAYFRGRPKNERAGRNFHSERDQRIRTDDGTRPNFGAIENDRAHADENFVVDLASVDDGAVADRDQLPQNCWISVIEMDDGIVLNV